MHRRKKVDEKSGVTPAGGTSNELDVQNEWEENTTNTMCDGVLHRLWFVFNVFLVSLHGD